MGTMTVEDFGDVTAETLDDVLSTGFAPQGAPGTEEHAMAVADALGIAGRDIYWDYESYAAENGPAATAASHANISMLQSAADYAASVMKALAGRPDLLAQVQSAIEEDRSASPAP